jgi:hypothetical protein
MKCLVISLNKLMKKLVLWIVDTDLCKVIFAKGHHEFGLCIFNSPHISIFLSAEPLKIFDFDFDKTLFPCTRVGTDESFLLSIDTSSKSVTSVS